MAEKVSFIVLKHRRTYLIQTIGGRLRDRFALDKYSALPPVTFYTPRTAALQGLPATGWYDFENRVIGMVVNPENNAAREWTWAVLLSVHEHLHWLWNYDPRIVGIQGQQEMFLFNIFADASNEQRAIIEDVWAGRLLKRGRTLILSESKAKKGGVLSAAPLHDAAWLTLAAHTILAAKGHAMLKKLHAGRVMHDAVWQVLATLLQPSPQVEPYWEKAWGLCCQIWRERNEFIKFDLIKEFQTLFPPVEEPAQPEQSDFDIGGHVGQDKMDGAPPPGRPKSELTPQQGKGSNSSRSEKSEDDLGDKEGGGEPGDQSVKTNDAQNAHKGSSDSDQGNDKTPLEFDSLDDSSESSSEENPKEVQQEMEEIKKSPDRLIPGISGDPIENPLLQLSPDELIYEATPYANELAQRLKAVNRPQFHRRDNKGSVIPRVIARVPDAENPFRNRSALSKSIGPGIFVNLMLDNSGSLKEDEKFKAVQLAAMSANLALLREKVAHIIVTSKATTKLAGDGMRPERGFVNIAGFSGSIRGGDNLSISLPQMIRTLLKRKETVKVLVVVSDGQPGNPPYLKHHIEEGRKAGLIIVGLGLELNRQEAQGMRDIFGVDCVTVVRGERISVTFAALLGQAISAAILRGKRAV